ncbi:MAG: alpha/beta fold hydrolase [Bacteroidota bacterium]
MKSQRLKFPNKQGQILNARLDLPLDRKPLACAVFAHCFTCSSNLNAVRNISGSLTQQGVAVLRFDFTGLGQSEGEFADTNFSSNVEDLLAAAECMAEAIEPPQLLIGHSLGGAAVLMAGLKIPSIKAVATIGAPADPVHVKHLIQDSEEEILAKGVAEVNIGGRPFTIKRQFIDDLLKVSQEHVGKLKKALLVMHSPQDEIVNIKNAELIYKMAMHPKSYISLDGADHLLTRKADAVYAGSVIASWAMRYIELRSEEDLETEKQVVVHTGSEGYTTEIRIGPHRLLADEPESVGGENLGPTPYGLLAASLGACTSMTLRMYANRKKWDLQEVKVHLSHAKDYAEDCEACEREGTKIDIFDREIELVGKLDDKQRARLLEMADRCPVHKTLHADVHVNTKLKEV